MIKDCNFIIFMINFISDGCGKGGGGGGGGGGNALLMVKKYRILKHVLV
jgi:hypothetical protein